MSFVVFSGHAIVEVVDDFVLWQLDCGELDSVADLFDNIVDAASSDVHNVSGEGLGLC